MHILVLVYMTGTWPAMNELVHIRKYGVNTDLCDGTECTILRALNSCLQLSVHDFGILTTYFMFHDDFLRERLSPLEYRKLMCIVNPQPDHHGTRSMPSPETPLVALEARRCPTPAYRKHVDWTEVKHNR
jgi:hypothetical protein